MRFRLPLQIAMKCACPNAAGEWRVDAFPPTLRRQAGCDRRAGAGCREIIGGSRREERLEVFARNMPKRGVDPEHYPHLSVPSVGRLRGRVREGVICTATASSPQSGLGFERTLAYVTGQRAGEELC
jgi:hypothetical protein